MNRYLLLFAFCLACEGVSGLLFAASTTVYVYKDIPAGDYIRSTDVTRVYTYETAPGMPLRDTETQFDPIGRQSRVVQLAGAASITTDYSYDSAGNISIRSTETDTGDLQTVYEYDERGRQITVHGPSENLAGAYAPRTVYSYDANSNVTLQLTRAHDDVYTEVTTAYDAANRATLSYLPVFTGSPATDFRSLEFDSRGNAIVERHFRGQEALQQVRTIYDGLGRVATRARSANPAAQTIDLNVDEVTRYLYDAGGRVLREIHYDRGTRQRPLVTASEYDRFGRLTKRIDPLGYVNATVYDVRGLVVEQSRTDGATRRTAFHHDDNGRLTMSIALDSGATAAGSITTRFTYDCLGRRVSTSLWNFNPQTATGQWQVTSYDYDMLGRQTLTTEDAGGMNRQTGYVYSRQGQLSLQIAGTAPGSLAGGQTTKYEYSPEGLVNRIVYPDEYPNGSGLEYSYYANGAVRQKADQAGITLDYTYDPRGLMLTKRDSTGSYLVTFEYDGLGRMVTARKGTDADPDATSATVHAYDHLSRVTSENQAIGGSPARAVGSQYDQAGRRISLVYPQ